MDTFSVDRPFYDIGSDDELRDFWDADLDPTMQEVLRVNSAGDLTVEWSLLEKDLPGVVLHDKLMTDAALGTRPIKTEHSYSCVASDGDSLPDSPISSHKMDDMEDECFPTISMKRACGTVSGDGIIVKHEPLSEPESPESSCPASPTPEFANFSDNSMDTDMDTNHLLTSTGLIMRNSTNLFSNQRIQLSGIKLEPFTLPPTPPCSNGGSGSSSSSEESEDSIAIVSPASPAVRKPPPIGARIVLTHAATPTRQPIHTPLISTQPKGSTGTLVLTDEEKRTLIAEGYPVPTRLPLSKAEEKSLKKIRRKIKNKISAQESRRKKKEYMDQLERKVELLVTENSDYRKKIENLEDSNATLMVQLSKLQAMVARSYPHLVKTVAK